VDKIRILQLKFNEKEKNYLLIIFLLSLPLSIAVSQICYLFIIAVWLANPKPTNNSQIYRDLLFATLIFVFTTWISSLQGINPGKSTFELIKLTSTLLVPFALTTFNAAIPVLRFLVYGQAIAAIYSLTVEVIAPDVYRVFPGPVTESGQLVLTIPISIYLAYSHRIKTIFPILLICALLVSLKRGPWLAVSLELVLGGLLLSNFYLVVSSGVFLSILLIISKTRERIFSGVSHFLISGGRLEMWEIGFYLTALNPFGIGFKNSKLIREIDSTLPLLHRHFHNNYLNIMVECGWLGLGLFLVWSVIPIRYLLQKFHRGENRMYYLAGALGLIGYHFAGLWEYNFGDGEVRMILLVLLGVVLFDAKDKSPMNY